MGLPALCKGGQPYPIAILEYRERERASLNVGTSMGRQGGTDDGRNESRVNGNGTRERSFETQ